MTHETVHGSSGAVDALELLQIIRQLADELHPGTHSPPVQLDSSLDRDLGLDSLARMELLARLEQTFAVRLPEQVLASAETPRDLLRHLDSRQDTPSFHPDRPAASSTPAAPPADHALQIPEPLSLVEVLGNHAELQPDRVHILLDGHSKEQDRITFLELQNGARRVAAGLQRSGVVHGDTVALILPTGREYFFTFFGVLLAGGIPVPLYPPVRPTQIEEHLRRHRAILQNAGVKMMVTMPEVKQVARLLKLQLDTLVHVNTVRELDRPEQEFTTIPIRPGDIAFLQYTSGSTGDPKGVILTHANLLANIRAMGQAAQATSTDVFVSWLPLYHDMGLIGAWLGSLYYGCRLVIMPPLSFLARPERWLWAIHKHHGTLSASPNFGYELCCRRISDAAIKGLDLRSWRMALNGAEPVSPGAITGFCNRFAPYGFQKEAMAPVYGLAESSVGLAFPPLGREPVIDRVERDTFTRSGKAVQLNDRQKPALEFVACGRPLPGHQIKIVDPAGRELPERQEGCLLFQGPSATSGYYRNPDKTARLFHDGWLDSGDLAYIAGGDVYVTGRTKDIIIRGGRNIYPHELEEAVGNISGLRKGCIAVFGSRDRVTGTEQLIVLAESRKKDPQTIEELKKQVTSTAVDLLGMPPDNVIIAPPGTVLKTSSGKIRRSASRELYETDRIGKPKPAVWLQVARIFMSGLIPQVRKFLRQSGDTLYAGYCWALFSMMTPFVWLLIVILPVRRQRWQATRMAARLLALLTGTRLQVQGRDNIPLDRPVVIASNHMSYLDAFVLQAVLPLPCSFIAKAELADRPLVRLPLSRLGAILVERFDRERGMEDAERLTKLASGGEVFLFFPEGTFQRVPGLLPFRMGAFLTSVQAGIPLVPVTIRGTRSKLRSGSWFPRQGPVSIMIGRPILPTGNDWAAAVTLRETARREILDHLGEPDLAGSHATFADLEQTPDREGGQTQ
jgi:1-acyl-sn-glycerol-3-phosphate acyltransferase